MPRKKQPLRLPRWLLWGIFAAGLTGLMILLGGLFGYQSGQAARVSQVALQGALNKQVQFDLAVQDLAEGRYEFARQRLEWVLAQDPSFPSAAETLAGVMQILYATATPTALPPTATPTPTRDPRPLEELFNQAQAMLANSDWTAAIDTLNALRKDDRAFRTADVDGMLYLALRYRGVNKILQESNLEGGMYDLALAERFGPLDNDAESARNWARIYMIGNSFWEADPERAVYYFQQVAAGAPHLTDGSGWTAAARYRGALIQLGDLQVKKEQWCEAAETYELALSYGADAAVQEALTHAMEMCLGPTETPTETPGTPTLTLTPTWTPPGPTATLGLPTNTPEGPTSTPTVEATAPVATETPTQEAPTAEAPTPTSTQEVVPTETPAADPTETPQPPTQEATATESLVLIPTNTTEPPAEPLETVVPESSPDPSTDPETEAGQ